MSVSYHSKNLLSLHQNLYFSKEFADVTLVSEDYISFEAHKTILAHSSVVLRKLLCLSHEQKPILYLRGVKGDEIENLLKFLYLGENWLDLSIFHHLGLIEFDNITLEQIPDDKVQLTNSKNVKVHKLDFLFQSTEESNEANKEKNYDNKVAFDFFQGEVTAEDADSTDNLNFEALPTHESNNQIQSDDLLEGNSDGEDHSDKNLSESANIQGDGSNPKSNNKRKKEEPAECDICAVKFTTKRSLQRHIKIQHELHMEKCPVCGLDLKGRESLRRHIKSKHEEKTTYYCDKCEYKAVTERSVKVHRLKVHIYTCTFCQITYTEEEEFRVHIKEEHVNKFC